MAHKSYYLYQKYVKYPSNPDWVPTYPMEFSVSGDSEDPMPMVMKMDEDPACGGITPIEPQYRWVVSTGYVCSGTNKMTREIEEVSYDSGTTWTPTGDERAAYPLIEADSPDCGYIPPIEPIYRWVNMDISTDYICDECPPIDPQYRTLTTATTCINYDKYVLEEYQVSYDSGVTWTTTGTSATTLIEADSPDCGYVPPTPNFKWKATYTGGSVTTAECDSTSAITSGEISKTGLTSVEIGDCVTNIGDNAFERCSGLTSVTIPNSITRIGNSAFPYCSGLTSINIPSGVTSIGIGAFYYCTGLTSVTIDATTPPTLGSTAFSSTNDCPILVPNEAVQAYKSASGWSSYASRIQAIS